MSNKLKTNVLGFPRIGKDRELKKAEEAFWAGKISKDELIKVSKEIKEENWKRQKSEASTSSLLTTSRSTTRCLTSRSHLALSLKDTTR